MSDGDYDEGGLMIDEDQLDTSGNSSQPKIDVTETITETSAFDECTSEIIERGVVNFNKNDTSIDVKAEKPPGFNNFSSNPLNFERKFTNGPDEENSSDSQNFGYAGGKRSHVETEIVPEPGNEGIKNFLAMPKPDLSESKKKKIKMMDASTCVLTRGSQVDDTHLHLRPGMTTCINITIVYRAGANTYYVIAKFKGKEYHGVLSDGEPPLAHSYGQKRSAADKEKDRHENDDHGGDKAQSNSAHKHRAGGKRGGRNGGEKRVKHESVSEENKNTDGSHHLKTPKSSKIFEAFSEKPLRRCPHEQCGYRFETINEMNAHLLWDHVQSKAVMKEEIACQASVETTSIGVNTDPEEAPKKKEKPLCSKCRSVISQRQIEDESIKEMIKAGRSSNSLTSTTKNGSPAFSDISDDAPTLEKEAPFDTSTDGNQNESPKKSLSEPMLLNTTSSTFSEMLSPTRASVVNPSDEASKLSDASKQPSPTDQPATRPPDATASLTSASSPISTPKRDLLGMATTPQPRRTPQHPSTPVSSLPAASTSLVSTPTSMAPQQLPTQAQLISNLWPGHALGQAPGFMMPGMPGPIPQFFNRPPFGAGLPTNGISPVTNPPKSDSAPIRHKIHELKSEPQSSVAAPASSNVLTTPSRPSTSNSTPANPGGGGTPGSDLMLQAAAMRGNVTGTPLHHIRPPSMPGLSAFGFPGQSPLSIPQPSPMMAPSPQAQAQAQAAHQQQQQQAAQQAIASMMFGQRLPAAYLPPNMGNMGIPAGMLPGVTPEQISQFASAFMSQHNLNSGGGAQPQNPSAFPPK